MTNAVDATLVEPIAINILILADGRLRFDTYDLKDDYSLALMIEALHQTSGPVVSFSITTAYRKAKERIRKNSSSAPFEDGVSDPDCDSEGQGSDIADFRFDSGSVGGKYDEIWIFGDQAEALNDRGDPKVSTTQLAPAELCVLRQFMDRGGGVFATGDHLSLGASINAYVPRVRVMRTWRKGPGTQDPNRNNTQKSLRDNPVGSEIDIFPQQIIPVLYGGYPHPVLDGSIGIIDVLPDHPHEGQCAGDSEPLDVGDFPCDGNPLPVVVAHSNRNQRPASDVFPAISAYDGHLANVGRVLVDASFHHFVKVNLNAYRGRSIADQPNVPVGTKAGDNAYEVISNYYHNIAVWLAPREKQRHMFMRALWELRWGSSISGLLVAKPKGIGASLAELELDAEFIARLGQAAKDSLGRLISPSLTLLLLIEALKDLEGDGDVFFYPWVREKASTPDPSPDEEENMISHMMGGIMLVIAVTFPEEPKERLTNFAERLEDVVRAGLRLGLRVLNRA